MIFLFRWLSPEPEVFQKMASDDLEFAELAHSQEDEISNCVQLDLHTACSLGELELIKIQLNEGQDVNSRNLSGWTPLMFACWGGHVDIVAMLIQSGADVYLQNHESQTPIHIASKTGCLLALQLVFKRDLVNNIDQEQKTALYYAADYGFQDILKYLLENGADANKSCRGMTPLMVAAVNNHYPAVEQLLAAGALRHAQNSQGLTALQLAEQCGSLSVTTLLTPPQPDVSELKSFLEYLSLEKYWPLFESQNVDLKRFLKMNEEDLKSIGLRLLGPRRKMFLAIQACKKRVS